MEKKNKNYSSEQIQVLEGLEAVRVRPGMYIGSTNQRGLHHIVYEIVDNFVDEALAGFCSEITVSIEKDNSITVSDNGRGIPVDIKEDYNISALEIVYTKLHAGGKFGVGGYKVSGGLQGVGASVVNELSSELQVKVYREGKIYFQEYEKGVPKCEVKVTEECDKDETGIKVHFVPDNTIFEKTIFDFNTLKTRFRETPFLTKGLKINLIDKRDEKERKETFHYEGGLKEFVEFINKGKTPIYNEVFYCEGEKNNILVEVGLQHNDSYTESIYTFVNNINTPEGGTHLTSFRNSLTKIINDYARENKFLKENEENLSGEDRREGLTAIISVKIEDLKCEG